MTSIDVGLLAIRLSLGLTLFMHGWNHWRGGGGIAGTAGWFSTMGLRHGRLQAWASVVTELGVSVLLVLGFLTPFACAASIATMCVAIVITHAKNGFFVFRDGYEYALMISVVAAALALIGPGTISLDDLFRTTVQGPLGLAVALALGLGAAGLLLAATWRPTPA